MKLVRRRPASVYAVRRRTLIGGAVALTLGLALVSAGATAAVAASPPSPPIVHFLPQATVRGSGAGAVVTMSIACPKPLGDLEISVQQRQADGKLVSAGGFPSQCTRTPTTIVVPVCSQCQGYDTSWPGSGAKLRPGAAKGVVFYEDANFNGYDLPAQSITLSNSARLDHMSDATNALAAAGSIVANGAAADLDVAAACRNGHPVYDGLNPPAVYQVSTSTLVNFGTPLLAPTGHCTRWSHYRVRVYPQYAPFRAGPVFVLWAGIWGQVTLR